MEFALIKVFVLLKVICMATETPISRTSYRFEVYTVDKCPMNQSEFEKAATRMNCSRDTRYLCAPDRDLSNLIEFCTDVRRSLFGPDNCVRLEGTGDLNHYNCKDFSSGCPWTPYFDDEIYRYPACLSFNRVSNCFLADLNCTERICNTTTLEMCLNNSKSVDSKLKTSISETHSNKKKIIIFAVFCVSIILVVGIIIGNAFHERLLKNKGKTTIQINEEKLRDFLSKGKMTVRHVRCIVVGCGGAGKSTLLRRLQNAKFKDLQEIKTTQLVDVHVNIFDVLENENTIQSVCTKKNLPSITFPTNLFAKNSSTKHLEEPSLIHEYQTEENEWELKDKAFSENELLFNKFENKDSSVNEETESYELVPRTMEQNESPQFAPKHISYCQETVHLIFKENTNDSKTNIIPDNVEKHAFLKIMNAVKDLSNEKHLCPRITFLDFAGQSLYYAFHQIYLSPKTCYILVVDMTKGFNEKVSETDETRCSLFESWTYKDFYKFWLKSIDSYSDIDSPVIIVGTHAENLTKQDSKDFFRDFFCLFEHHPTLQRHLHEARCFAIGFPDIGSKLAELKEIKTCIASIVNHLGFSNQIRPVWAIFEHILQEEKGRRIISRKTLLDYNKELSNDFQLNENSITEMLLFLHRVGNVLYFDDDLLRETIILDVQWLVDAFKCIIAYHENISVTDRKSSRFKTTGELSDQELIAIWEGNKEGETFIAHKTEILSYMEQLGLLAICDAKKGQSPSYYILCMNKRRFKNSEKDFKKSSILCFQFNENGQLPYNIFYRLVVKCLKIPAWSILQENGLNCLYDNVACFSYQHSIIAVCLCKFQIQLQVWIPDINGHIEPDFLCDIQRSVEENIGQIRKYSYKIGYKCKNGIFNAEEDSSIIEQTAFPVSKLNCPNCKLANKHYVDNKICWIQPGQQRYKDQTEGIVNVEEELSRGSLLVVKDYVKKYPTKINQIYEDKTVPQIASYNGNMDNVKFLLKNKAEPDLKNSNEDSPLHHSALGLSDKTNAAKIQTTQRGVIVPSDWVKMDRGEVYKRVVLSSDGGDCMMEEEYQMVAEKFKKTLGQAKILQIERIQNPYYWECYQLKKMQLEHQYGGIGCSNEKELFHGTLPTYVEVICKDNLDFRLAGERVRTLIGKGAHFAIDAKYSDLYSQVDKEKNKYMFLVKVLCGKWALGDTKYSRPPPVDPKNPFSELYDCCVDNVDNPRVFCVFDRNQFYPQYLIKYKW